MPMIYRESVREYASRKPWVVLAIDFHPSSVYVNMALLIVFLVRVPS